ncbi:glycosyltransferase family 8 protein [Blautia sp. HCP3S3_H10_1]|uniref:glycosyltransferase family 8 protein n=1 Tax=unclassified Blautia TaxID=2648079 RepID=UPI003F8EA6F9
MNIVYIATDSYISLLGISINSILMNRKNGEKVNLYICSPDLTSEHKTQLSDLVTVCGGNIHYIDISDYAEHFHFQFDTSGFHPIVLARLFLTSYLPEDVDKVLYLDCDVIVNGNIWELEKVNLQDKAFGAVPELCMPKKQKAEIGLGEKDTYFNCGVMLINLDYWREKRLSESFLEYFIKQNGMLLYNDQDILNHCCKDRIQKLSHTYNYNPALYYFPRYFIRSYQPEYYCASAKEYEDIRQKPVLIHFMGEERPWVHGNYSPYRTVYEKYKLNSPWKDMPLIYGKEKVLFCYHILNCITKIFPWFRKWFTRLIGIYYYQLVKKS